jgi:hypothetical protein
MYAQLAKNKTTTKIQAIERSVCTGWTWMVAKIYSQQDKNSDKTTKNRQ